MTDSIHSQILILQSDSAFGNQVAENLYKDRHEVLGPVSKIINAYKILLNDLPDLALIDASVGEGEINRLSDTLVLMGVPHLINYGRNSTLVKRTSVEGQDCITEVYCAVPLEESIAHTLWDMHIQRVMFHWLEDAIAVQAKVA